MIKHALAILIPAAVIILTPLALLAVPSAVFGDDWTNNLWMIAYSRAHLLEHFSFPDVFNVQSHVGIPTPIFYGPLLYPLLTIFSLPLGPELAVRFACLALWTAQFALVYRLSRSAGAVPIEALAAGAVMSWSIYPLTNLYNRGALAEFFATGLLLCSLCAAGLAITRQRGAYAFLAALLAALAFGSHAPTALVGGGLTLLLLFAGTRRPLIALGASAAVLIILSPWLYAVGSFSRRLMISLPSEFSHITGVWTRFASIDGPLARFSPLPLGISGGSLTSHLDAQWNFPLAILAAWNAYRAVGRTSPRRVNVLMLAAAGAAVALLFLSVSETLQDLLPHRFAAAVQFPYRLVGPANIAMFVLLIAAWWKRAGVGRLDRHSRYVLITCLVISATALAVKMSHAAGALRTDDFLDSRLSGSGLSSLPLRFTGQNDYTLQVPARDLLTADPVTPLSRLSGPAGEGPSRPVKDVTTSTVTSTWVVTSVLNFPWNRLIVDGQSLPFDQTYNLYFHEAAKVEEGSHTFGYQFEPDAAWLWLNRLSWLALAILLALTAVGLAKKGRPRDAT